MIAFPSIYHGWVLFSWRYAQWLALYCRIWHESWVLRGEGGYQNVNNVNNHVCLWQLEEPLYNQLLKLVKRAVIITLLDVCECGLELRVILRPRCNKLHLTLKIRNGAYGNQCLVHGRMSFSFNSSHGSGADSVVPYDIRSGALKCIRHAFPFVTGKSWG